MSVKNIHFPQNFHIIVTSWCNSLDTDCIKHDNSSSTSLVLVKFAGLRVVTPLDFQPTVDALPDMIEPLLKLLIRNAQLCLICQTLRISPWRRG